MIRRIFRLLVACLCLTGTIAHAQGYGQEPAAIPQPPISSSLQEAQMQGITNTIMHYPSQTPAILQNYVGIDVSRVDIDKFMSIVQTGDYQAIYNEVSYLYNNAAAFNSGALIDLPYYQVPAPIAQAAPAAAVTTAAPAASGTGGAVAATGGYLSTAAFFGGAAVVAGGIGIAAATGSSGDGGSENGGTDAFGRQMLQQTGNPASFVDTEFNAYPSGALYAENAQYAYAKGLTGAGVIIGFHDFFATDGSENNQIASRIVYRNLDLAADQNFFANSQTCQDHPGNPEACNHGIAVAGYAANARDGIGSLGVAYQANLALNSIIGSVLDPTQLADNGAQIINFSCTGCILTPSQLDYIAGKDILMTSATGNTLNGINPDVGAPAAHAEDYDYRLIAVTGVYDLGGGNITNVYNHCGDQMQYCMAAYSSTGTSFAAPQIAGAAALIKQGWSYLTAKQIGQILLISAKDIGAPGVDQVYGHGLLDLKAATSPIGHTLYMSQNGLASFSNAGISQNPNTAFGDAFSNGKNAKGNLTIVDSFGRDFAVKAQDNLFIATAHTLSPDVMQSVGRKKETRKSVKFNDRVTMNFAQGDSEAGGETEYAVNRNMKLTLGFATDIESVAADGTQPFDSANFINHDVFQNGFLHFSDNNQVFHQGLELATGKNTQTKLTTYYSTNTDQNYFKPLDDQIKNDFVSTSVETKYAASKDLDFKVKGGLTHEFDSVLGSNFNGGFDMGKGADTYFTGLDASYNVTPALNFYASYLIGTTKVKPSANSAFTDVSDIISDSFTLTATQSELMGRDKLSFSVGQPMRVRSGTASGLTSHVDHATGAISTAQFEQSLVPSGRTLMFQAAYDKALSDDINLNMAVEYANHPYQNADSDSDTSALVKMIYKFK